MDNKHEARIEQLILYELRMVGFLVYLLKREMKNKIDVIFIY
jgi:hypothetical protein